MKKIMILILCIMICCGCEDKKNLLDILFPSSMAINYQDGEYEIAFQIDNLNTVAKKELESGLQQTYLLVASGKGPTIEDALNVVEETQRSVINFSHIRSLIILPGALDSKIQKDICNFAILNPQFRLDTDVYYSEEKIKDIYSVNFQVARSDLYTLSNSPEFKKVSNILKSINIMQLAKAMDEPQVTLQMPILKIDNQQNQYLTNEGDKIQKVYHIEHLLYLNHPQKQYEKIPFEDLKGIQWTNTHHDDVDVNVEVNEQMVHAVSSKVQSRLVFHPQTKTYHLQGDVEMVITRDIGFNPLSDIQPEIEKEIHQQIKHTYEVGIEKGIDVYNMRYLSTIFNQDVIPDLDNFQDELEIKVVIKGSYIGTNT